MGGKSLGDVFSAGAISKLMPWLEQKQSEFRNHIGVFATYEFQTCRFRSITGYLFQADLAVTFSASSQRTNQAVCMTAGMVNRNDSPIIELFLKAIKPLDSY